MNKKIKFLTGIIAGLWLWSSCLIADTTITGNVTITEATYGVQGQYIVENGTNLGLVAFGVSNNTTASVSVNNPFDAVGDGNNYDYWDAQILDEFAWNNTDTGYAQYIEGLNFTDYFAEGDHVNFYYRGDSREFAPGHTVADVFLFSPEVFASSGVAILTDNTGNYFAVTPIVTAVPLPSAGILLFSGISLLLTARRNVVA